MIFVGIIMIGILLSGYLVWRIGYQFPCESFPNILSYHKVIRNFEIGGTWTTPTKFASQMKYLQDNGFRVIATDQLWSEGTSSEQVLLTFDDGYENFYLNVFPILKEYNFSALVFLITGFIGKENLWDVNVGKIKFRHLNWEQVREMRENGIEFGSHTQSHRDLTQLCGEEIFRELEESKRIIEANLGREAEYIAYPFGRYDERVRRIAREVGYKGGFSLCPNHSNKIFDDFAIKRTAIYVTDNLLTYSIKLRHKYRYFYWYQDIQGRIINRFSMGTVVYHKIKKGILDIISSKSLTHLSKF